LCSVGLSFPLESRSTSPWSLWTLSLHAVVKPPAVARRENRIGDNSIQLPSPSRVRATGHRVGFLSGDRSVAKACHTPSQGCASSRGVSLPPRVLRAAASACLLGLHAPPLPFTCGRVLDTRRQARLWGFYATAPSC
jgi:hypothetical protein